MSFEDENYRPRVEVQILEAVGIVSSGGVKLVRLEVTRRPDGSSIQLKARDLGGEVEWYVEWVRSGQLPTSWPLVPITKPGSGPTS